MYKDFLILLEVEYFVYISYEAVQTCLSVNRIKIYGVLKFSMAVVKYCPLGPWGRGKGPEGSGGAVHLG